MFLLFASDVFAFFLSAFAVNAKLCDRAGLQTGDTDFFTAIFTQTVRTIIEALKSSLYFSDQPAFPVADTEGEGPVGFCRGPVCGVGKELVTVSQILNGRVTLMLCLFQHAGQQGAEVFNIFLFQMYLLAGCYVDRLSHLL